MSLHGNPKASLDAIASPSKLTLGKIAVLCRMNSPLLIGVVDNLCESLAALYVIEKPLQDCVINFGTIQEDAILWGDSLTPEDYRSRLGSALDSIAEFFEMLPRPSASSKKNSVTDGLQSSLSGSAQHTATKSGTSSGLSRRSKRHCSGGATPKGQAV